MSERPITALLRADRLAAELHQPPNRWPSIFKGAPSHSGAYLLQALDELGWELLPRPDDDLNAIAERAVAAAHEGVGMDELHQSISAAQVRAAMEMLEAAGLVVMEGETR
jgi:hypothetical protein